MPLKMGPVLLFRGLNDKRLHLCALAVTDGEASPGALEVEGGQRYEPEALLQHRGTTLWRVEFCMPAREGAVGYQFAGRSHQVYPPPANGPRILFTACNGSEVPDELPEEQHRRLAPWRRIAEQHQRQPFHLLIQGGDQIYADQLWHEHEQLTPLKDDRAKSTEVQYTDDIAEAVFGHYYQLYVNNASEPGIGDVLASVPSLMIWDDHDIFDGWGSWRPELQRSAVFQGIYAAARTSYAAFQVGAAADGPLSEPFLDAAGRHYGWVARIGDVGLYAPDLRSERTQTQVMGEIGWADMDRALERLRDCRQVFVVSSVPLLNSTLRWLERAHFAVPGHQFFQDDLRDQWQSYAHEEQWVRFTDKLLRFKRDTGARVAVLSGEIHFAAWGLLDGPEGPVHQLTSSGVVHPAPPRLVSRILGLAGWKRHRIGNRASFRMHPLPGLKYRYLADRNWLTLDPAPDGYRARWCTETHGDSEPLTLD